MKKTTVTIILLCTVVSLYYWFVDPEMVYRFLAFRAVGFLRGEVWTPITSLFVHANPTHLVGNMAFLYVFGNTLEESSGAKAMAAAFFVGGVFSFILSVYFYGLNATMVGASAAIFTVTAAVMLIKPLKFSWLFLMPLGLVAMLYFTYNLMAVHFGAHGNIGYISHVIGFLTGFPFGIACSRGEWAKNLLIAILLLMGYAALMYVVNFIFLPMLS